MLQRTKQNKQPFSLFRQGTISKGEHAVRRIADNIAWQRFWLSAIALKRALDFKTPFDFKAVAKSGPTLLVGEGNFSFSVALSDLLGSATSNMTATTFQPTNEYSDITSQNARVLRSRGVRTWQALMSQIYPSGLAEDGLI